MYSNISATFQIFFWTESNQCCLEWASGNMYYNLARLSFFAYRHLNDDVVFVMQCLLDVSLLDASKETTPPSSNALGYTLSLLVKTHDHIYNPLIYVDQDTIREQHSGPQVNDTRRWRAATTDGQPIFLVKLKLIFSHEIIGNSWYCARGWTCTACWIFPLQCMPWKTTCEHSKGHAFSSLSQKLNITHVIPAMVYAWLAGLKHVFQTATHQSRKIKSSRSWVPPLKGLSSLITVIMFL